MACAAADGLRLHPDNPHYFLWRGKPAVLITSGEHYGAVLNRDFDYVKYLDTLAADGLNLTRTWTGGTYCEPFGAFNISENTLAPKEGKFLCPFARSDKPGYRGGGNKFDLERWDDAYFARFRDFVKQADARGVIVEVNLFCPFYEDGMWVLSPLHPGNNVNGVGSGLSRTNVYTMDRNSGTLAIQEKLVRKLVAELRDFGNAYFEICNEPYFGGVTLDWQRHIAGVIEEAQKIGRFTVMNGQSSGSKLPESDREDMEVFLGRIVQLLPVLGCDLLTPILDAGSGGAKLRLTGKIKGATAQGQRTAKGFVVFANSEAVTTLRPSAPSYIIEAREELKKDGALAADGEKLRFSRDTEFSSPSMAGAIICGGHVNGLTFWRNKDGRELKEIEGA